MLNVSSACGEDRTGQENQNTHLEWVSRKESEVLDIGGSGED